MRGLLCYPSALLVCLCRYVEGLNLLLDFRSPVGGIFDFRSPVGDMVGFPFADKLIAFIVGSFGPKLHFGELCPMRQGLYVHRLQVGLRRRSFNVYKLLSVNLGRHSGADGVVPGAGCHQVKVAAPRAVTPITQPSSTCPGR
jgi:hypothetical protein